jgi:hypothetical protein
MGIQAAFQTLGQLAMHGLMSDAQVSASMGGFQKYLDQLMSNVRPLTTARPCFPCNQQEPIFGFTGGHRHLAHAHFTDLRRGLPIAYGPRPSPRAESYAPATGLDH